MEPNLATLALLWTVSKSPLRMRSRENIGSAEMNGVVECKTCGSKARPVSVAYDRQRSIKQSNWKARNVLLVLGDCTLIALQVRS